VGGTLLRQDRPPANQGAGRSLFGVHSGFLPRHKCLCEDYAAVHGHGTVQSPIQTLQTKCNTCATFTTSYNKPTTYWLSHRVVCLLFFSRHALQVKCWLKGIESDQGYQNFLFYNGYFNTKWGNATLFHQVSRISTVPCCDLLRMCYACGE
jgi:hypothetical protein